MEIGVSQSIITQKNTTGSTIPGYSSTKTWDIFWNNFQIFLDVETSFTLLGFQVVLFLYFSHFPRYYWVYLSNKQKGGDCTLKCSLSVMFLLVCINKYHIGVIATKI